MPEQTELEKALEPIFTLLERIAIALEAQTDALLMAKHPHPHTRNPEGVCVECGDGG